MSPSGAVPWQCALAVAVQCAVLVRTFGQDSSSGGFVAFASTHVPNVLSQDPQPVVSMTTIFPSPSHSASTDSYSNRIMPTLDISTLQVTNTITRFMSAFPSSIIPSVPPVQFTRTTPVTVQMSPVMTNTIVVPSVSLTNQPVPTPNLSTPTPNLSTPTPILPSLTPSPNPSGNGNQQQNGSGNANLPIPDWALFLVVFGGLVIVLTVFGVVGSFIRCCHRRFS